MTVQELTDTLNQCIALLRQNHAAATPAVLDTVATAAAVIQKSPIDWIHDVSAAMASVQQGVAAERTLTGGLDDRLISVMKTLLATPMALDILAPLLKDVP